MSEEANGSAVEQEQEHVDSAAESKAEPAKQDGGKQQERAEGITIAYNHEKIPLSNTEAARLAQIGKRFEGKETLLTQIEAEFKRSGMKSVDEFIQARQREMEKKQVDDLMLKDGVSENTAQELIRLRGLEQQLRDQEQKESRESKLLNELRELKERYPDVDINALPEGVSAYSVQNGVPIVSAYENVVLLEQYRKELNDLKKQRENEEATAGSAHSSAPAVGDDSFESLWAKGTR